MSQPVKKAILTGGGRATRLRPITSTINKHLIPLAGKPMIFHAIEKVIEAGITEIFINTNPGDTQIQAVVGDGSRWGVVIKYFEQTGGPQGIAHVVKCAEPFIGTDPFMFYLSDNIILGSLKPLVDRFAASDLDCLLTLSKVPDPERFGVPQFDATGKLVDVLEKPTEPPSDFAVTGIYLYNQNFFKTFNHIEKSARGEYEISSIHSFFLKQGYRVGTEEITGWWKDTGKPDDLLHANQLLIDQLPLASTSPVPEQVVVIGSVWLGKNVVFKGSVTLRGPVIIGDNVTLEDATIGPYVTVGTGSVLKQTHISNSILFNGVEITKPLTLSKSIIGEKVRIRQAMAEAQQCILGDFSVVEL
jgi:glucose-1-phosphate thymidylyltransferase